jgi:2-dehydro-3-deoxy-D-arabinonate dehydratase
MLSRHANGWAINGRSLPANVTLSSLLAQASTEMGAQLRPGEGGLGTSLPPCDPGHEIWACGVTYLRSRQEREAESSVADVYARVYEAERPEIFFKANGSRAVGDGQPVRMRRDSHWNVPEPELVLIVNRYGEIIGYTAGNDMSSRSIEGENPLYLPQAKTYDGSCALGPAIILTSVEQMRALPISLKIERNGGVVYQDETSTSTMRRSFEELVAFLFREMSFPHGVLVMTGTGIVPPHPFTLARGDQVEIVVGELTLRNEVA